MVKLRLPRTLAYVALSGGLALGAAACRSSGSGRTDAAASDGGVVDSAVADGACEGFCMPQQYYDDGGAIPFDALPDCPNCPTNGTCPPGCNPLV